MDPSIVYVYNKKRGEFGKHVSFSDTPVNELGVSENKVDGIEYVATPFQSVPVDATQELRCAGVNTERISFASKEVSHCNGSWPPDVDHELIDSVLRYKRKILKGSSFARNVSIAANKALHCVMSNNSLNLFETYFDHLASSSRYCDTASLRSTGCLRDVHAHDQMRYVRSLSWSCDQRRIVGAYVPRGASQGGDSLQFTSGISVASSSYVWDVAAPTQHSAELTSACPAYCVAFNDREQNLVVGGLTNGSVCLWDTRDREPSPSVSSLHQGHTDVVRDVCWTQGKTGNDFASVSGDKVLWWDCRKLESPLEEILLHTKQKRTSTSNDYMHRNNGNNNNNRNSSTYRSSGGSSFGAQHHGSGDPLTSHTGCVLTHSMVAGINRVLVGTQDGSVLDCHRFAKGSTPACVDLYPEAADDSPVHYGPITSLVRNPFYHQYFLSTGDWGVKVWSDTTPLPVVDVPPQQSLVTCGCWSTTHPAVAFTGNGAGNISIYDVSQLSTEPILEHSLGNLGITSISMSRGGDLVAAADENANITLLQLSSVLREPLEDKQSVFRVLQEEARTKRTLDAEMRRKASDHNSRSKKEGTHAGWSEMYLDGERSNGPDRLQKLSDQEGLTEKLFEELMLA